MYNITLRPVRIFESWTLVRWSYFLIHCGPTLVFCSHSCTYYNMLLPLLGFVDIFVFQSLLFYVNVHVVKLLGVQNLKSIYMK
jgi:hypothetical protein